MIAINDQGMTAEQRKLNSEAVARCQKRHPDRRKQTLMNWRKKHPEAVQKHLRNSYQRHRVERLRNQAEWYQQNKNRLQSAQKLKRDTKPEYYLYHSAKTRAKKNGIPFNILLNDIVMTERCPVLGVAFTKGTRGSCEYAPSLDRIIPSKGYVKGNICVISWRANRIKHNATLDEITKVIRYMRNHK